MSVICIYLFMFCFCLVQPQQIDSWLAPLKVAKGLVVTGPRLNLEGAQKQTNIEQMTYRLITSVASGSWKTCWLEKYLGRPLDFF